MPSAPQAPAAAESSTAHRRYLQSFPHRTYGLRVLGMGLAGLPLFAVLHELRSPWPAWAWALFSSVLWPHLAYLWARNSRDPFRAELRNFVIDNVFAGSWLPLMHFNILPSAVLLSVVTADKVNTGVRKLWMYSLPGTALALIGIGLMTGFAVQPNASMTVVLASLPILVIHTLAVSMSSYRLLRKVQGQNLQLEEISRVDALTGLDSRGHWQSQAMRLLRKHHSDDRVATVMLLDVDQFKAINDQYGHSTGDDVLRDIAEIIRQHLPADGHAGRLGGDEFAIAVEAAMAEAQVLAEKIRTAVDALRFAHVPGLHCSLSIGLANPPDADLGLREWMEAADRALYRAKHRGRNRTVSLEPAREPAA